MAKKVGKRFVCQECGQAHAKWAGRCPACGAWNSLLEEEHTAGSSLRTAGGRMLEPVSLRQVVKAKTKQRLDTKLGEVNQVVGGGIVPGSLLLLAGEPGIGKSTLLLQVANGLAKTEPVLYVSGEESLQQLKLRAERLSVKEAKLDFASSISTDDIAATIATSQYPLVIIDSIQTMATEQVTSAAGSISQVTTSAQIFQNLAKDTHTAVLLVGHVTKEGSIAGPKLLEHIVDVVLYLEGERFGNYKLLRSVKNRFGSTYEVGIFEMTDKGMIAIANPSAAFLKERTGGDGSVVLATLEGSRALLVEVQALVSQSPFGYPKRTAAGFDLNRLNLLLAVLGKRAGINLGSHDVYINIVGGMKVAEPAADLAVAMAMASAHKSKQVTDKTVVFGEVGLSGEIRSVHQVDKRLSEAKKLGFRRAIAPAGYKSGFIKPARTLSQAIAAAIEGNTV